MLYFSPNFAIALYELWGMWYHTMQKSWGKNYEVGYGIISMQGKEAKHSALKTDLKLSSNCSNAQDGTGKWHQIARSSFVQNFYLPYHFPIDIYTPHSDSRNPPVTTRVCGCFRPLSKLEDVCTECIKRLNIVEAAEIGSLTENQISIMKPIVCDECSERYADQGFASASKHTCSQTVAKKNSRIILRRMKLKRTFISRIKKYTM